MFQIKLCKDKWYQSISYLSSSLSDYKTEILPPVWAVWASMVQQLRQFLLLFPVTFCSETIYTPNIEGVTYGTNPYCCRIEWSLAFKGKTHACCSDRCPRVTCSFWRKSSVMGTFAWHLQHLHEIQLVWYPCVMKKKSLILFISSYSLDYLLSAWYALNSITTPFALPSFSSLPPAF